MNKLLFVGCCLAAACAIAAKADEEYGGIIRVVPKDAGKFLFVNAQQKVAEAMISAPVERLAKDIGFDLQTVKGTAPDPKKVPEALAALGAKGAVWIVDDPQLPRLLAACEDGWAILNVAQLAKDVDDEKIRVRMIKEINRTFGFIHGATDPIMMPACALKPAVGLDGLDKLQCKELSPFTASKVSYYLTQAGYKRVNVGTYYDACEEGWAPKPTNAVQKAIWDKVHQLPTKPLTIQRESERSKGK